MRRVGPRALAILAVSFAAPLALTAIAQQGPEWVSSLKWPDGKEVQWRASSAPACDGSNVELRLLNNSTSAGMANVKSATFACKRRGEFTGPERLLGLVSPGGASSASTVNCACADQGGVKELLAVDLEFLRNGEGQEAVGNGCSYSGNYAGGQRSGRGVYSCTNGYRYDGEWLQNIQNGRGIEILPTGEKYEGNFVANKHSGNGRLTYTDGAIYEGEFKNGLRDGVGTLQFKDGARYVGEWKADQRTGNGAYTSADKTWTYDGDWVTNIRDGNGKLVYADGSYTYEGPFKNDKLEGQGTGTFGDGRVFQGKFVANQQIGAGTLTFPDGRKIVGDFKDQRPNGQAIETGPVANFNGTWTNGALNGKAIITYATGDRFEGMFANGKRNGLGVDTRLDGSKEECTWVNDVQQKPCTQITKDGKRIEFRSSKGKGKNN